MKSTIRAFIAIDISTGVLSSARRALRPLKQNFPDVKWVEDENFHVTLKFLGPNVPTSELHKLIAAIERACRGVEQFDLVFEGMGAFPDASSPRTIWIGVADGANELRVLAARIDAELDKLGYPPEGREFSPHLTVGRTRQKDRQERRGREEADAPAGKLVGSSLSRMISERAGKFFGVSPVDSVVLYSSELDRNGSTYVPLATVDLAPLGSIPDDDEAFNPRDFDDDSFDFENDDHKENLDKLVNGGKKIDLRSLDVEDELRAICGDAFTRKPEPGRRSDARKERPEKKSPNKGKGKPSVSSSARKLLSEETPEIDAADFSDLQKLLDSELSAKKPDKNFRKDDV